MKLINSEEEYYEALERLDKIFNASINTDESDEADVLALIIDEYERKNFAIEDPDPIEAIKIRMEELNLKPKDLINDIGKNRVNDVLNRKSRLTLRMIRKLTKSLNISPHTLINEYQIIK